MENKTVSPSLDRLERRAQLLRAFMFGLECGDDLLFSNKGGNLSLYRSWGRELRRIDKQIEKERER